MNNSQREAGVLAEQVKKSLSTAGRARCKVEIRAVAGTKNRALAEHLQTSLRMAGLEAELLEVPAAPREDVLIETSHQTAQVALALQTAFLATGTPTDLLVQAKAEPKVITLHLGAPGEPGRSKKKAS